MTSISSLLVSTLSSVVVRLKSDSGVLCLHSRSLGGLACLTLLQAEACHEAEKHGSCENESGVDHSHEFFLDLLISDCMKVEAGLVG